jgi:hypothetical protein
MVGQLRGEVGASERWIREKEKAAMSPRRRWTRFFRKQK